MTTGPAADFVNRRSVSLETMRAAIDAQVPLVSGAIAHARDQFADLRAAIDPAAIDEIVLVGCGDSLYAGMAARLGFVEHAGIRTEAVEALEFSRYGTALCGPGTLVIAISAGGNKSRTIEAVRRARQAGALTLALTGRDGGAFADMADLRLTQNESDFRVAPPPGEGTFKLGNYVASLVTMFELARFLGVERGHLTAARSAVIGAELAGLGDAIRATIEASAEPAARLARELVDAPGYHILGGGPNFATALFMAAKMFELPQRHADPVELEEWAHEQFFLTRSRTIVLVVTPNGASVERAREQLSGARESGATIAAVGAAADDETRALVDHWLPVVGDVAEVFSPIVYCVPGQLLATEICRVLGQPAFSFATELQYELNKRLVAESEICT